MTHNAYILVQWIRVATFIAAGCTTAVPIIYSLSSWRTRRLGQLFMLQAVSFALAMDLSCLFIIWQPKNIFIILWTDTFIISAIAVSTSLLAALIWRLNHPRIRKGRLGKMKMNSRVYDVLKNVAQIYLPALGTLYFALSHIWGLPNAEEVTGTVIAVDTFLGVILGISSATFNATAKYDGTAVVTTDLQGKKTFSLELEGDPSVLDTKEDITFRVKNVSSG